jgi:glycosyltransferase involved in cell wall biosynthesis
MRLLYATPYYLPERHFGGPPEKIHALAKGLVRHGHSVAVFTFKSDDRSCRAAMSLDGVHIQYLPWVGRGLKQLPITPRLLRRAVAGADLVQCHGIYNLLSPVVARLASVNGKPYVLEPLGMYPPRARNQWLKHWYNRIVTQRMGAHAAAVIAASEAEAIDLRRLAAPEKIVFRRNGVNLGDFADIGFLASEMRHRLHIEVRERVILFVGRISPVKNLEQLVHAFAKAAVPRTRLVLVGPASEPTYETRLRSVVAESGLGSRIIIAGPLYGDDRKAAFGIADLVVLPSLSESFGNAAAEAVAAGVPVLLTETCGVAPVIHRRAGLAVPLGVDSLAEGIKNMLDPGFRAEVAARIADVKRELSWDEPIEQTIGLYERILAWPAGAAT